MEVIEALRSPSSPLTNSQIRVEEVPKEVRDAYFGVQTPEHETSFVKLNDILATTLGGDYEQLCYSVLFEKGRPGMFACTKDPVNLIRRANHGDFAVMLSDYEADQVDKFRGPPGNPNLVFGIADPVFHSLNHYAFGAVSLSNKVDLGLHQIKFFADLATNPKVSKAWNKIKGTLPNQQMADTFDIYVDSLDRGPLADGLRRMPKQFIDPDWVPLDIWPKIYTAIAKELISPEVPQDVLTSINNALSNPKSISLQEAFLDKTVKYKAQRIHQLALRQAETLPPDKAIIAIMDRLCFEENKRSFSAFTEVVRPLFTSESGQEALMARIDNEP